MVRHALQMNFKARRRSNIMHNADVDSLFLQHLALLNVQLAKGSIMPCRNDGIGIFFGVTTPLAQRFDERNIVLFTALI